MKQNQGRTRFSRPQVVGGNPFDFRLAIFYRHYVSRPRNTMTFVSPILGVSSQEYHDVCGERDGGEFAKR